MNVNIMNTFLQNIKDLSSSIIGIILVFGWAFSGTLICIYWVIKGEFTDAILSFVVPFYGIISIIMTQF